MEKEEAKKEVNKVAKAPKKEEAKKPAKKTEVKADTKKKAETKKASEVKKTATTNKKAEKKTTDKKAVTETKKDVKTAKAQVAKAVLRHERISPRKVNIVAKLIRGKDVQQAKAILKFTSKAASQPLTKLIDSCVANAVNNHFMDESKLYISELNVMQGPTLKRIRPRARGSADRINKRTSHISVVLKEREN